MTNFQYCTRVLLKGTWGSGLLLQECLAVGLPAELCGHACLGWQLLPLTAGSLLTR